MYLLADKYDIAELANHALREYWRWLNREGADGWFATVESLGEIHESARGEVMEQVVLFARHNLAVLGGKRGAEFVRAWPELADAVLGRGIGYGDHQSTRDVFGMWQRVSEEVKAEDVENVG